MNYFQLAKELDLENFEKFVNSICQISAGVLAETGKSCHRCTCSSCKVAMLRYQVDSEVLKALEIEHEYISIH